eukprot:CAMPEP_0206314790 /NCGR_PEP_ID=MMETSP0106_2-20121207/15202_1 /ASSEMBLY_ACC=CAM_ASM_000206 /TAXON_ID=81532 /ORGANISM="Acanthoeca-like sp., Strain 10tr" /LENGTH=299 /DNA_ID=CAMNT_0053746163 /DNA_START=222 /DNA_END=1117 /DNA_ORIENTATION=+
MAKAAAGEFVASKEYQSFRSSISLKKEAVEHADGTIKTWSLYDYGTRSVKCPLVFLPPATGTADVFYKQLMSLGSAGFRVLAVDYPVYWTHADWCEGFAKLLDALELDSVHLFGASLGGFLAQKFAEHTKNSRRVQSIVLCNSFTDTNAFSKLPNHQLYKYSPSFVMKRLILKNFPKGKIDPEVADSVDFVVERLDSLSREELASRLTMNTMPGYVEPHQLNEQEMSIMLIDVLDQTAISPKVREDVAKCYPDAKVGHIKTGGNFAFLSRDQELNVYIKVHLRHFAATRFTAGEDFDYA